MSVSTVQDIIETSVIYVPLVNEYNDSAIYNG